jgi:hypothetical protein
MTSFGTVISYPIPPYSNPPIEPQFYKPRRYVISNISLGFTTIVTTSVDHDYVIGQEVRLLIPAAFGCYQLNNLLGYVLSLPALNQVEISINSLINVNQYIAATSTQSPQILAVGDINQGYTSHTGRWIHNPGIPGAFLNISPK